MIHILHLEDELADSELTADLLREAGFEVTIERVHTSASFKQGLGRPELNLILSDYTVPGLDALEMLRLARESRPEIPVVFLSGTIGEETATEVLKQGAADYVLKGHNSRLAPAIRRALHEAEEHALRRQGDVALANTTARFDGIISSAMDAIISIDVRQRIVLFNPAAERMFGLTASQALGRCINDFIPERFRAAHTRHVEEYGRTGVSNRAMGRLGDLTGLRANGEEFPIEASISQTEAAGEKLLTVILRDVTQRKLAQEALARSRAELEQLVVERTAQLAEANANLQTFAYTAAHDLRSPLRSIRSFSSLVVEDYAAKLGPDGQSLLERVMKSAEQMDRLLNDLLDYSRMSQAESKLEPVDLRKAIGEALGMLDADIRARDALVTVGESFPAVTGHPATVLLLISNLLSNALKFVSPGVRPQIRIWAEPVQSPTSEVKSLDSASGVAPEAPVAARVRLWVEDNGIGIEQEDQGKLFGVFQRIHGKAAYPGTGLGLAIVRKGAERMGGCVGVESQPGRGSRFWLELREGA